MSYGPVAFAHICSQRKLTYSHDLPPTSVTLRFMTPATMYQGCKGAVMTKVVR